MKKHSSPFPVKKSKAVAVTVAKKVTQSSSSKSLSKPQLRELEKRLTEMDAELRAGIEGKAMFFNASSNNESLTKGDDAEVAEKQRMNNAALQEIDILKNRLMMVRRALSKIKAGVYGICEETEEPIGYERLIVVPWARYAVHVQEIREKKMREYRVSRLRSET